MKKVCAGLTLGLALSGCVMGSGYPTNLADGAYAGIWTSKPAADVRACIDRLSPPANPASAWYEVTSNDTSKKVYATTISIMERGSDVDATTEKVLLTCAGPAGVFKPAAT